MPRRIPDDGHQAGVGHAGRSDDPDNARHVADSIGRSHHAAGRYLALSVLPPYGDGDPVVVIALAQPVGHCALVFEELEQRRELRVIRHELRLRHDIGRAPDVGLLVLLEIEKIIAVLDEQLDDLPLGLRRVLQPFVELALDLPEGAAVQSLVEEPGGIGEPVRGDIRVELGDDAPDQSGSEGQHQQHLPAGDRYQFHPFEPAVVQFRRQRHADLPAHQAEDVRGMAQQFLDAPPVVLQLEADPLPVPPGDGTHAKEGVHVIPVALVRRNAPGRGVGAGDVPGVLEIHHGVPHRRGTDGEGRPAGYRLGTDGLARGDMVFHQAAEDTLVPVGLKGIGHDDAEPVRDAPCTAMVRQWDEPRPDQAWKIGVRRPRAAEGRPRNPILYLRIRPARVKRKAGRRAALSPRLSTTFP